MIPQRSSKLLPRSTLILMEPALSTEPFDAISSAETCYEQLAQLDVTKESIETTVSAISSFLSDALQNLQVDLLEMTPLKSDPIVIGIENSEESPEPDSSLRSLTPKKKTKGSTRTSMKTKKSPILEKRMSSKGGLLKSDEGVFASTQLPTRDRALTASPTATHAAVIASASSNPQRVETEDGEVLITITPLEAFQDLLNKTFRKIQTAIADKLVAFLDERVACDRTSLQHAKSKAMKQLFVAREMADTFRRSYDAAHRHRETEAVRLNELEIKQKFTYELLGLKKTNKQLDTSCKILTMKVEQLEESLREKEAALERHKGKKASPEKTGGDGHKHRDRHASGHNKGHSHGHSKDHGHGHGHGHDEHGHPSHYQEDQSLDGSIQSHHSHHTHHSGLSEGSHPPPFHAGHKTAHNLLDVHPLHSLPHQCTNCDKWQEKIASQAAKLLTLRETLDKNTIAMEMLQRELEASKQPPSRPESPCQISVSCSAAGLTNFGTASAPASPLTVDGMQNMSPLVVVVGQVAELTSPVPLKFTAAALPQTVNEETADDKHGAAQPSSQDGVASAVLHDVGEVPILIGDQEPVQGALEAKECAVPSETLSLQEGEAAVKQDVDVGADAQTQQEDAKRTVAFIADSLDRGLQVQSEPDVMNYPLVSTEDAPVLTVMPQLDNAGSIILPDDPQFTLGFAEMNSPSLDGGGLTDSQLSLDLGSLQAHSSETVAQNALFELSNVTSGIGFLPGRYVEGIQEFFTENEKFFGRRVLVSTLKLTDVFGMLQDGIRAQRELSTQILSLEFLNSQLSDHIRTDEAYIEHQEKLHSLQLLERGILLRELAAQVNTLRADRCRMDLELKQKKNSNSLSKRVKGIKPQSEREPGSPVKPSLMLPNVKIDLRAESEPAVMTPSQAACVRLLESSVSMPMLSDEYGPLAAGGYSRHVKSRSAGTPGASHTASPRVMTAGANGSRSTSAIGSRVPTPVPGSAAAPETSKVLSAFLRAVVPPPERGPSPEAQNRTRIANTNFTADINEPVPTLSEEKIAELKAIRKQIMGLVAERYPRKKAPHRLATTAALKDALDGRVVPLNPISGPGPATKRKV